jgi:hypothetical protein
MQPNLAGRAGTRIVAFAFFVLGLALLGGALINVSATLRLLRGSIATDGRIVDVQRVHRVRRTGYTYMPVVRFTMQNGQIFMVRSNKGANPPAFKLGDAVKVYYKPDHPEWAVIDTFGQLWAGDTVLGCVGLLMMGMGGLFLRGRGVARQRHVAVMDDQSQGRGGS